MWQYGFVLSFFASTIWKDIEILLWSGRDWNFYRVYTNDSQFQSGFVHMWAAGVYLVFVFMKDVLFMDTSESGMCVRRSCQPVRVWTPC
jgi:hypothetical protein